MNCYYIYAEDSAEIDRRWQADRIVVEKNAKRRTSLKTLVDALQSGDTLIVRSFSAVSDNSAAFLDRNVDIGKALPVGKAAGPAFRILRAPHINDRQNIVLPQKADIVLRRLPGHVAAQYAPRP